MGGWLTVEEPVVIVVYVKTRLIPEAVFRRLGLAAAHDAKVMKRSALDALIRLCALAYVHGLNADAIDKKFRTEDLDTLESLGYIRLAEDFGIELI